MDPIKAICVYVIAMVIGVGFIVSRMETSQPNKICFEGISYIQFDRAVIVQVDSYGLPVGCK